MSSKAIYPTKLRVIKCAFNLFKKRGYNNVTIQDICKESKITKSTFYYHFPTKDSLLDDFNLYSESFVVDNLANFINSESYVEQLWSIYKVYTIPILDAGVEINRQGIIKNLNCDRKVFAPGENDLWDTQIILIEKAQKSGQIKNHMPAVELVTSLIYAMDGIMMVWCIKNGQLDLLEEFRRVFETMLGVNLCNDISEEK